MRINDYAMIGDGRSAALVSRTGAIDWLCWPRFDSLPIFGALLDPIGGSWQIAPVGDTRVSRRYIDDTNVVLTTLMASSQSFGLRTPISVVVAHLVFGIILGVVYRP